MSFWPESSKVARGYEPDVDVSTGFSKVKPYAINRVTGKIFRRSEYYSKWNADRYEFAEDYIETKLKRRPEKDVRFRFGAFKKSFLRWMHKVAAEGRVTVKGGNRTWMPNESEYDKDRGRRHRASYLPDNELWRALPPAINRYLHKPHLSRNGIAELTVWMTNERMAPSMGEMLFYSHYNKPVSYKDGSLPPNHEYWEFIAQIRTAEKKPHLSFIDEVVRKKETEKVSNISVLKYRKDTAPVDRVYRPARGRIFGSKKRQLIRPNLKTLGPRAIRSTRAKPSDLAVPWVRRINDEVEFDQPTGKYAVRSRVPRYSGPASGYLKWLSEHTNSDFY